MQDAAFQNWKMPCMGTHKLFYRVYIAILNCYLVGFLHPPPPPPTCSNWHASIFNHNYNYQSAWKSWLFLSQRFHVNSFWCQFVVHGSVVIIIIDHNIDHNVMEWHARAQIGMAPSTVHVIKISILAFFASSNNII